MLPLKNLNIEIFQRPPSPNYANRGGRKGFFGLIKGELSNSQTLVKLGHYCDGRLQNDDYTSNGKRIHAIVMPRLMQRYTEIYEKAIQKNMAIGLYTHLSKYSI